jgi:hypothetical protein
MPSQTARNLESSAPLQRPTFSPVSEVVTTSQLAPVRQAYKVLQLGFVAAPIIAGADKFFHLLTNWDQYLAPIVPRITGLSAHTFMQGVGVIEIVAGIGVAIKPKIFSYVVSGWLGGIVVNLLMTGKYFDIALRDFGLALGALALGRLSPVFGRKARV